MPAAAARKAGGGGRGPYLVLGLVSALAAGAIGFVHYDQQKQRQVGERASVTGGVCGAVVHAFGNESMDGFSGSPQDVHYVRPRLVDSNPDPARLHTRE